MSKKANIPKDVLERLDSYVEHRMAVTSCPYCFENFNMREWVKTSEQLILDDDNNGKEDCFIVVSSCPKCFEKSWLHFTLDYDGWEWKQSWKKLIKEESEKRKIATEKEWEQGICKNCKLLIRGRENCYSSRRFCQVGMGRTKLSCSYFAWEKQ